MKLNILLASVAAVLALASGPAAPMDEPDPSDKLADMNSDFAQGRRAVEARDWKTAITSLTAADKRTANNAEIHNLLGFAYRNSGQIDVALKHYQRALQIDSRHRGAHEYIGEAYLMLNDAAKAEEHLATLRKLCPSTCPERDELAGKITQYRKSKG
jgi:tetratricopeptide (TPR) repeat protein